MTESTVHHAEEVSKKSKLIDARLALTPEEAFNPEGVSQVDMLACVLNRAQGILSAVQSTGEDGNFSIHHSNVMAALGAVDGLIHEAKQTVSSIKI